MKNIQNRGQSALGIDANITALSGYLLFFVAPILVFTEKDNKFVRFHALQSSLWSVISFVCLIGIQIIRPTKIIRDVESGIVLLIFLGVFFAYMGGVFFAGIKSALGVEYKLPIVGKIAQKLVQFI